MPSNGNTTARGYGSSHQARRARFKPIVESGGSICRRCGEPILPRQNWDLGHDDDDRSLPTFPEHANAKDCEEGGNRATKGRKNRRGANAVYLVTGPPASGKSTWVREHAKPGDITVDFDAIANVLTPPDGKPHKHTPEVQAVTKTARQAAIDAALGQTGVDVYIIHSAPGTATLTRYRALGAHIITIDPGRDIVLARCRAERPWQMQQAAKKWYDDNMSSKLRDTPSKQSDLANAAPWFFGPDQHNRRSEGVSEQLEQHTSAPGA